MGLRRNWFAYLAQFLYLAASLLILIFGVTQFADKEKYPYLTQMLMILGLFMVFIIANVFFYLITRPKLITLLTPIKKASIWVEAVFVLIVLIAGLVIRIYYINKYQVAMESDYKFYYDVARMIKEGTLLTESNNEYIALFPHTIGYSYILSKVIAIFGTAPEVCLYFNAIVSVLTAAVCYGIGKKTVGSVAGISALMISCFWPSQILFSNINGAEAVFTFLLYSAALLFIHVMKKYDGTNSRTSLLIFFHFLIGVILGLASSVRPMSLIFLIAVVLCLAFLNYKLKFKNNINELSFGTIFMSKGWMRLIIIVIGYILCTQIVTARTTQAIQKDVAGSGAMGYSLMVGLDRKSDGGYSDESMKILYDTYNETKSADKVNQVCLDKAINSVKEDPIGTMELLAKKFYLVWSNDDYATTTNIVTMSNQRLLTREKENLMKQFADINNVYYLFVVFLSMIGVCFLFRRDNNALVFAVFFVGAVMLHLIVEMQNRYHYYLLQNFSILAAVGLGLLFQDYLEKSKSRLLEKQAMAANSVDKNKEDIDTSAEDENSSMEMDAGSALISIEGKEANNASKEDEVSSGLSTENDHKATNLNTIDVLKAIEDGHIIITATKAYENELTKKSEIIEDNKE